MILGQQCLAPTTENPAWFCKVLNNCPAALTLVKQRKTPPVHRRCGFKGSAPVVCCPPYEIADWNSVTPLNAQATSTRRPAVTPVPTVGEYSTAVASKHLSALLSLLKGLRAAERTKLHQLMPNWIGKFNFLSENDCADFWTNFSEFSA